MRRTAILAIGLWLAATAAQAQAQHPTTYGSFSPRKSPPRAVTGGSFAPLPGSEPYRIHTPPAYPKSPGVTDGGQGFKPFKGSSVYSHPTGLEPKPAKPKYSTYNR